MTPLRRACMTATGGQRRVLSAANGANGTRPAATSPAPPPPPNTRRRRSGSALGPSAPRYPRPPSEGNCRPAQSGQLSPALTTPARPASRRAWPSRPARAGARRDEPITVRHSSPGSAAGRRRRSTARRRSSSATSRTTVDARRRAPLVALRTNSAPRPGGRAGVSRNHPTLLPWTTSRRRTLVPARSSSAKRCGSCHEPSGGARTSCSRCAGPVRRAPPAPLRRLTQPRPLSCMGRWIGLACIATSVTGVRARGGASRRSRGSADPGGDLPAAGQPR
jgi:hypothetical protein